MPIQRPWLNLAIILSSLSCFCFADPKPGDYADYHVDKNPKRTSSMIREGTLRAIMGQLLQSSSQGPAYEVTTQYHFKIALMGNYDGEQKKLLEKEFFTPEFLEKLRKDGHYEGSYFKAKHLGYEDAKTMEGVLYSNCDKILLYDLKDSHFRSIAAGLLSQSTGNHRAKIDQLEALVHLYPDIPVFSAAQLDVSGVYQGSKIKAGGDYVRPQ